MKIILSNLFLMITILGSRSVLAEPDETTACSVSDYDLPGGLVTNPRYGDPAIGVYLEIAGSITPWVLTYETPFAIRTFSLLEAAGWNCVAAYDSDKHDGLRRTQRPIVEVPETVCGDEVSPHTTGARAQCYVHMAAALMPNLAPEAGEGLQEAFESLSTNPADGSYTGAYPLPFQTGIHPEVSSCAEEEEYEDFKECVNILADEYDYIPAIIGSILAQDALWYGRSDGFNIHGTNEGHCKNNCRPYSDTTSYKPKNMLFSVDVEPRPKSKSNSNSKHSKKIKKQQKKWDEKYKNRKHWQPLLEDDGRGFFYRQEHVTPHIGTKATPRILTREDIDSRQLEDPEYDLQLEAELVLDRLRNLDDRKKMEIELFDDKTEVLAALSRALFFRYFFQYTYEQNMLFIAIYTASEYDAVLLSWKEKIRHDLVRPTTVIQQNNLYGTPEEITTWGGLFKGVETFPSKNFQPYIRVMPHAEYPSGSGCICQAGVSFTKAFMRVIFSDDGEDFVLPHTFKAGSSKLEPGVTPASDISVSYSMDEYIETCGQSRLNGGMHFTAAVEDSYGLCEGFEEAGEQVIYELLNGSDDLLTIYVPGPIGGPPGGGPPSAAPPSDDGGGGCPPSICGSF